MKAIHLLFLITFLASFIAPVVAVRADDGSPWSEILNPDGTIQWNNLLDLGNTSEPANWMDITLPGGMVVHQNATFHRYQTPSGNILVLPEPVTLFFMALHPQESGLNDAESMLGNGVSILMLLIGNSLTPEQLAQLASQGYTDPQQFFQAVIDGKENIWSLINLNFLGELFKMSWDSGFLVNALLLYLNGVANCANIPGGCAGLLDQCPEGDCLPNPSICPEATIAQNTPTLAIQKIAPDHPLVVGQDPAKRGADIQASVNIPPVVLTWYEQVQDPPTCEADPSGNGDGCPGPGSQYGNDWEPWMEGNPAYQFVDGEIHCVKHTEILPENITSLQASAQLNPESQAWIVNDLAGKYYEAYVHNPQFSLVPGMAQPTGGCSGDQVCSAEALVTNIPFADPGTFDLRMYISTSGTSFTWKGVTIPITQPRVLFAQNTAQIYVTLVTLLPAGAP
ncbi:MAG: hypothetical protein ACXWNC_09365 [Anaerolineales bacterium]